MHSPSTVTQPVNSPTAATLPDYMAQARRLRFSAPLEQEFRADYFTSTIRIARIAIVLAAVLYAVFSVQDIGRSETMRVIVPAIRFGVVVPVILAFFGLTFTPLVRRYPQPFLAAAVLVGASFLLVIDWITRTEDPTYVAGMGSQLIALYFTYSFGRLRFRYASAVGVIFTLLYALATICQPGVLDSIQEVNLFATDVIYMVAANATGMAASYFLEFYARLDFIQRRALQAEHARSEMLLLNILPGEIVTRLKASSGTVAQQFDESSILFADLVNFTPLSARISAHELVDLLNELFSAFDTMVEQLGLEKIKTIGDCYMVAAGVPTPRADHACAMAQLALAMRDYVQSHIIHGHYRLNIRIGINSGPVVAGIIGKKKFLYDMWGDTVNVASRMESHSVAGRIQITRAVYDRIADRFQCESLGKIPIKGRGELDVWELVRLKSAAGR